MPRKPGHANLSLLAIIMEGFLSRLSFGIISFALPLYAHHLGLSLTQIGFLASLNLVVAVALKPAMGWGADRFGLKRSFTVAIGLRSLVALLLAFAGSPWQLYAIRSAHGLSKSLRDPAANALIAEYGGKQAIASAFAWYQTAKSMAGALGKACAGILLTLTASNFSLVFTVSFLLSSLPLFVVARFVEAESSATTPAPDSDPVATGLPARQEMPVAAAKKRPQPAMLPFIGLGFLISGTAKMLHGLFPILATEYAGLSEAQTGLIYTASTLVILFSGPLFGWLSDNVSRKLVLLVRGGANTLSSMIYVVAPTLLGVAAGKLVDDVGKAAFRPAWGALMTHVSNFDRRRRAQTMSLMSLGEDTGDIVGPILAGFLWNTWGIASVMAVRVLMAILAEVYTVALTHSLEKPEAPRSASGKMASTVGTAPTSNLP
ncbi:MAG: MFS transporter [Anaerolineae bacterium]